MAATLSVGAAMLGLCVSATASTRADSRAVVAVFPPWWDRARAVEAAATAGEVVRLGAAPDIVVVQSSTAGLATRLRASGAWLILDPIVALGCDAQTESRHG